MHTQQGRGYARSFGAQFNYQNRRLAGWAKTSAASARPYKASVKAAYPAFIEFTPYGEMLPNAQSYVDLDPERTDKFGLPLARRHVRWGENEEKLFNDMVRWSLAILEKAGAEILTVPAGPATNHELGGCRMGATRARRSSTATAARTTCRTSMWSMAACFPSASEKNPTHTIMALAARAADHIADRMKEVSCERDPTTRPEDAGHGHRDVRVPVRERRALRSARHRSWPRRRRQAVYASVLHARRVRGLSRLTDVIIPETETPGACGRRARIHRSAWSR